jgi:integrase
MTTDNTPLPLGALRSVHKKTGRKTKPYRAPWGESIDGLYREPDGRWRVTLPGPHFRKRFTESDPRLAVAQFRALIGQDRRHLVDVFSQPGENGLAAGVLDRFYGTETAPPKGLQIDMSDPAGMSVGYTVDEQLLWNYVAAQIRTRPKYVSERTGIEQIAYLINLTPPKPSPTLAEVGRLYHEKSKIDPHWKKKSEDFWNEFVDAAGGPRMTLRDLTQEIVATYKEVVEENPPSPTYVKHRFGQIKTIIAYGKHWGKWPEDRAKALAFCTILIPPSTVTMDPDPIEPTDFQKLLKAASESENRLKIMKPVLLLALNACLYGSEVTDVRWDDLDLVKGTLVMDRGKTQVVRVASLWPRTIEALRTLPKIKGLDSPFLTEATKQAHNSNTITKYYRSLRTVAGVSEKITFRQIRDGAYTAACEGDGIEAHQAEILAGHQTGMKDRYVKRRPRIVAGACAAIEREYFNSMR